MNDKLKRLFEKLFGEKRQKNKYEIFGEFMEEIRTRKVPFTSKPNQEYLKETYGNRMEDISGLLMQDESYGGYDLSLIHI